MMLDRLVEPFERGAGSRLDESALVVRAGGSA